MSAAPVHGITAPVAGSGKSKLVNVAATLATGHPPPVIALGQKDEETEKRLGAVQLAGDAVVTIDNAERPIGGELLCQAVTEPLVSLRVLGTSNRVVVPNLVTWFATGNNLRFSGDMGRRALLCRLDPQSQQRAILTARLSLRPRKMLPPTLFTRVMAFCQKIHIL